MKKLLIFLSGAIFGSVGTLIYIRKCVVPKIVEDAQNELRSEMSADSDDISESNMYGDEGEEYEDFSSRPKKMEKRPLEVFEAMDYTKYSKTEKTDSAKKELPIVESVLDETDISVSENTDPYLIDAESYDEFSSYSSHSFEVYADGIVLDEDTEEILDTDPELVFGKLAMDELKEAPDGMVYVRDDSKKMDYCLERRDIPFNGLGGLGPSDEDDWG